MMTELAPTTAFARQQMQQYITEAGIFAEERQHQDAESILKQSQLLTHEVDLLHATLTASSSRVPERAGDSERWLQLIALLTDLRRLLARIQAVTTRDKTMGDCRSATLQNIAIVEGLLDLLSSSTSETSTLFTAPLRSTSQSTETPAWDFTSLKQKALQGLDSESESYDDEDDTHLTSVDDDAESVLTDTEEYLTKKLPPLMDKPLAPIRREGDGATNRGPLEEEDFDEYGPSPTPAPTTTSTYPPRAANEKQETTSDTILQGDRSTQEALSGELLRMASVLKSNSLAFADALERDRVLLERAGEDLGKNLDLMTKTRGRLGVYSKKVRSMGWFTLGAIGVVMLSWMFMFVVIRLT